MAEIGPEKGHIINQESVQDVLDNKLSRRSFFRLAGGGIAAAVAAPYVVAEAVKKITVEYGWTWFIDKKTVDPTLADLVSKTLSQNKDQILDSLHQKNALYAKLHNGEKVLLEIKHISPEDQIQRMKMRMQQRLEEKQKKLIDHKNNHGGRLYPEGSIEDQKITFYAGYSDPEEKHFNRLGYTKNNKAQVELLNKMGKDYTHLKRFSDDS